MVSVENVSRARRLGRRRRSTGVCHIEHRSGGIVAGEIVKPLVVSYDPIEIQ